MSCQTVQKFVSAYVDRSLGADEQKSVKQHLAHCRECAATMEQTRHLRTMLGNLPVVSPPPQLKTRLLVMASHERERRLTRIDLATRVQNWGARLRLFTDNLMRPVALPFAGGLASALFLFSMLVPTLIFQFNFHNDVPIAAQFYTEPALIEAAPFGFDYEDVAVELTINERGQVIDCAFLGAKLDRNTQNSVSANLALFSSFAPATLFGRPTSGKVQLVSRRSWIVVRG